MRTINSQILFLLLLLLPVFSWAQLTISGITVSDSIAIENVHIINLQSEQATISNHKGEFSISAKLNDTLFISALGFEKITLPLTNYSLYKGKTTINLTSEVNQLDEVEVIHYTKINAVDLGIVSKNQKQYTEAEKRLFTAQKGIVEGVINRINGNVKNAKILVKLEQKEFLKEKIKNLYDEVYFIQKLQIPKLHIDHFLLYCMDDEEFCNRISDERTAQLDFFIQEKANLFLPLIKKS